MDIWTPGGRNAVTELGNKMVIAFQDAYSKYVIAYAIPDKTAETVAYIISEKLLNFLGPPARIVSDNAREFTAPLQKAVFESASITQKLIVLLNPKSNGQIERFFRPLRSMLASAAAAHPTEWDRFLDHVVFAYNTSVHTGIENTPFFLMFARDPELLLHEGVPDPREDSPPTWEEWIDRIDFAREVVSQKLDAQAKKQLEIAPTNTPYKFRKGDLVLVHRPVPNQPGMPRKLLSEWIGPMRITALLDKTAEVQWLVRSAAPRLKVHLDRMKPCRGTKVLTYEHFQQSHMPLDDISTEPNLDEESPE
jgi:hypothetical protein